MAWNWLGKSRTVLHGSIVPMLAEFLLNEADTRLPTRCVGLIAAFTWVLLGPAAPHVARCIYPRPVAAAAQSGCLKGGLWRFLSPGRQGLVPLRWGCALPSPNAPGKAPNHIHTFEAPTLCSCCHRPRMDAACHVWGYRTRALWACLG